MLDNRIYTFLELCDMLNYHKTAENLAMTQPAVTQHIQYLEGLYNCKLFDYANKKLKKTAKGIALEKYARAIIALNRSASQSLSQAEKKQINIGATKTIGDYFLDTTLLQLLSSPQYQVNIIIDNTERLLAQLNHFELDIVLLEGYVDKELYDHQAFLEEELLGICAVDHPFAGKEISLYDIFSQRVLLREHGSGTRAVLEHFLAEQGYSSQHFNNQSIISSNHLLEHAVESNLAISFVYQMIPQKNKNLATFRIKGSKILHMFHYVFLNKTNLDEVLTLLEC